MPKKPTSFRLFDAWLRLVGRLSETLHIYPTAVIEHAVATSLGTSWRPMGSGPPPVDGG